MIPASIRNRNPGAMYPGRSAKRFGSTAHEVLRSKDGVHKIATFPSDIHGAAAMFHLLGNGGYVGKTIEGAIRKWCGGYYASTYVNVLETKGGVKSSDVLTLAMLHRQDVAIPLCRAMAWQEAGRDYPLDDAGWMTAHTMAFGEAEAPKFAPHNDVPSPKPETRRTEAAKQVAGIATAAGGVVTVTASWFETAGTVAKDAAAFVTELGPVKAIAVEAGANGYAILMGSIVGGVILAISKWIKANA